MEPVRIYVGSDRSQWIGVKVLEHSIRRHASLPVEIIPMVDLPVTPPRDPKQDQRTGFSFSRFCIPKLAGYQGKAVYMDADMLVFRDIRELWEIPFGEAKVIVQEQLTDAQAVTQGKKGAPEKRVKQCSVMLLDCARLDWEVDSIVRGLDDKKYDYAGLMYELCIVRENEIAYSIPFRWNSLEHYDSSSTCLIHFTDMRTQPWVYSLNPNGALWVAELKRAVDGGVVTLEEISREIELGYARPSLLAEIKNFGKTTLGSLTANRSHWLWDRLVGFRAHAVATKDRLRHLASLRQTAGFSGVAEGA
jgi:hypothetical protein